MSQATDLMSNFIPGVGLPADQMSTPTFDAVTLFAFNFTFATNLVGASITHDDGISLFDITTSSGNLISGNEGPTVAATTMLPTLEAGHIYQLWYIAANGAPSILRFDDGTPAVPEPATWAMLVLGFGVIGVTARRRRAGSGRVAENLG
ncbi:PEPxxWA-CTERM sorting domain-containing protein [Sphingomonas sp. XMGL2]|uniref:PEPxxWA-CTERM sorting domain-containing protein n=2 Tax=Sphingomonas quercus TaxID=2842451 RepID=A0ABS6BJM9_9SPHN|nr:PEPxxWA-CTERM sorting domain-containing protein [Sphingomonas quercus]